MATLEDTHKSYGMGMHTEQLRGRSLETFFSVDDQDHGNFTLPDAFHVDMEKIGEIDAQDMEIVDINRQIRELMKSGHGHIVIKNPLAKHSLGVGILNRLRLEFDGSLGYFGCGLIDGPNVTIKGRVGWSCAENMMSGTLVVEKNAGSTFGAAIRGGDLVCRGDVGSRTGIDQKGGTILVGGSTGAFSCFMMQRGRLIVLGNAGKNLGDSMYDGTIYVGGEIASLGVDAVPGDLNKFEIDWLEHKLALYGMAAPNGAARLQKIVAGKQLWNYDNLEPHEKKIIL